MDDFKNAQNFSLIFHSFTFHTWMNNAIIAAFLLSLSRSCFCTFIVCYCYVRMYPSSNDVYLLICSLHSLLLLFDAHYRKTHTYTFVWIFFFTHLKITISLFLAHFTFLFSPFSWHASFGRYAFGISCGRKFRVTKCLHSTGECYRLPLFQNTHHSAMNLRRMRTSGCYFFHFDKTNELFYLHFSIHGSDHVCYRRNCIIRACFSLHQSNILTHSQVIIIGFGIRWLLAIVDSVLFKRAYLRNIMKFAFQIGIALWSRQFCISFELLVCFPFALLSFNSSLACVCFTRIDCLKDIHHFKYTPFVLSHFFCRWLEVEWENDAIKEDIKLLCTTHKVRQFYNAKKGVCYKCVPCRD